MIKLFIGLLAIMGANIFLGSSLASLNEEFNKENLIKGLKKLVCIVVALLLMYICYVLNPYVLMIDINGSKSSLIDGLELLCKTGIIYYSSQSLIKLTKILKISSSIVVNKNDEKKN